MLPYTFDDVVAGLNSVEPYDWAKFLRDRLDSLSAHAPLGGIERGGYKLAYSDQPNEYERANEIVGRGVNAWFSLGMRVGGDGTVGDVLYGGPAYQAGFGPGMEVIAVNGRKFTPELLHQALHDSKDTTTPMEFIVENTGYFKTVKMDYHGGERYPQLVRDGEKSASLDSILQPMVKRDKEKK